MATRRASPPASAASARSPGGRAGLGLQPATRTVQAPGAAEGALVLGGLVSWLVTRWRIEDDDLRIETGLFRRQSLRFPLAQVQAIDVVRPGLARLLRLAELRLRMAGPTGRS